MIDRILTTADAYIALAGCSESRASWRAFGDGRILEKLRRGSTITIERAERAMRWFAENWPDGEALPPALTGWLDFQDALPEPDASPATVAAGCGTPLSGPAAAHGANPEVGE